MKIMTVMAHPDDAAIWAGGTILKHADKGQECLQVSITGKGNSLLEAQYKEAAKILKSHYVMLDLVSASTPMPNEIALSVADIIIDFQPEILITHWNRDTHSGHVYTFDLVQRATIKSKIKLHGANNQVSPRQIYMCDSYYSVGTDTNFQPSLLIDISSVYEQKQAAVSCFSDQYLPLWKKMVRVMAEFNGGKCGCDYAEAIQISGGLASLGGGHKGLDFIP